MALTDNREKIQALIDGINALPDAGSGGGSARTCMVTVSIRQSTPPKYIPAGFAGFSYVDTDGTLRIQEITGGDEIGQSEYTFDTVECKCGSMLSVTLGQIPIRAYAIAEIDDPVMVSEYDAQTMASFLLPEIPGNYTIDVYYN